jgi:hypothetical protein
LSDEEQILVAQLASGLAPLEPSDTVWIATHTDENAVGRTEVEQA